MAPADDWRILDSAAPDPVRGPEALNTHDDRGMDASVVDRDGFAMTID